MKTSKLTTILLATALTAPVFAQTAAGEAQRDINQQKRIESGLQSGQLNTREAARLERKEAAVSRAQAHALKDGRLSDAEKNRIDRMQDAVSRDIRAEKHDAQLGNPNSASSRRMQADVQRNINQEQRIADGVRSGALTNRETARLEGAQARTQAREFRAGRDGHVGPNEQRGIQRAENRHSQKIRHEKHDAYRGS